jgi:hypothetical protein
MSKILVARTPYHRSMRAFLVAFLVLGLGPIGVNPSQHHAMVPLDSLTWRGGANGISTAIAEGDPTRPGPFTMMLKLADGAWLPPHWHNVVKRLYVIRGELLMGMGETVDAAAARALTVGGVAVVPANTRHFEGGRGETIVALTAIGPFQTTFVNAPSGAAPAPGAPAAQGAPSAPSAPAPPTCDAAEHRQFDFWLGEWEVSGPTGQPAGRNSITRELNGCVLHERWTGAGGMRGESFNTWDRTRQRWHQTWVSGTGNLLVIEGGLVNGAMIMSGDTTSPKGVVRNRITWTPAPDGSVRQLWETSVDGGKTWQGAFDGRYRRAK